MKILICHNFYQQSGGEDQVFQNERDMLKSKGHTVWAYERHNDEIKIKNFLSVALDLIWSRKTYQDIVKLIKRYRPDVIHIHNFFPLISPSVYWAAFRQNVPVVQTLHNQRLMCPAGSFVRKRKLCLDCLGKKFAWPAVLFGCYRRSRVFSFGVAFMVFVHRFLKTWQTKVSCFIVSTEFYKRLFVSAGLPSDKIIVKPHMVFFDPGVGERGGHYAIFIGRLDPEKGIEVLVDAWCVLKERGVCFPLKIRGEGQLLGDIQERLISYGLDFVKILERKSREEMYDLIKNAKFLIWPALGYYETFGLIAIEAFACGVPVIASNSGVAVENVRSGITGLHYQSDDPKDLAAKVEWALNHPVEMQKMGAMARKEYEEKYSAERNYQMLMEIYNKARNTKY